MKRYFLLFPVLLWACGGQDSQQVQTETPVTETASAVHASTLVFLDKSLSVNANKAFVTQKYTKAINELVQSGIQNAGDEVEVWLLHENTAKGKALELTARSEMGSTEGMSLTDIEAAKTTYDLSLQKERTGFAKQIVDQLEIPNDSKSNQQTDIRASLDAINQKVSEGYSVKAYFFSDMVESMKEAGRRDFHRTPPASSTEAELWAKSDAKTILGKYPNLPKASIRMVLPFEPTASSKINNPAISEYWKVLFKELGVGSVEEVI